MKFNVSPAYTVTADPASTSLAVSAVETRPGLLVPPVEAIATRSPIRAPSHRLSIRTWADLRWFTKRQVRLAPPTAALAAIVNVPPARVVLTAAPDPSVHTADVKT